MKYRLVHITENGPYDYTLRIEERISIWSRFFHLKKPKTYIIRGSGRGDWYYTTYGIKLPSDLIVFANEVIHEFGVRLRK